MVEMEGQANDGGGEQQPEASTEINLSDGTYDASKNDSSPQEPKTGDEMIDYKLVEQVRDLLRKEMENANMDEYSAPYLEEIMDPKSACTCWRFLIHNQLKVQETVALMKNVLKFRKEFDIDNPNGYTDLIKEFWHYCAVNLPGKTKDGHDILYITGKNYRKPQPSLAPFIRKFIARYFFEWDKLHRHDFSRVLVVFDVSDTTYRNIDLDFNAWLISIRDYLPARAEGIRIIGIPFLVRPLIRLVISWLPKKFRDITQCGTKEQLIDPIIDEDNLPVDVGGTERPEAYKLAPIEAPWAEEVPFYSDAALQKAIEECIGFSISQERRAKLRALQEEFESRHNSKLH